MHVHRYILSLLLPAAFAIQWSFDDAELRLTGESAARSYVLSPTTLLATPLTLGPSDSLTLTLRAHDGTKHSRPHQASLLVRDPVSGLESHFVIAARDSGNASLSLKRIDIPALLLSAEVVTLTVVLASFSSSAPLAHDIAQLHLPSPSPPSPPSSSLLPEIVHTFRPDPPLPHTVVAAVSALLPVIAGLCLIAVWFYAGANMTAMTRAVAAAPIAHPLFFVSLAAYECLFYTYWISAGLLRVLVYAAALAPITFFSGRRALGETMDRRRTYEQCQDVCGSSRLASFR